MADNALNDYMQIGNGTVSPNRERLRANLLRRLQDVVGLPSSRIAPQERQLAADLLLEVIRESDQASRHRCAERMALLHDVPAALLRFLTRDEIDVARPLLEVCEALDDSDLIYTILSPTATAEHRILIARRKRISETVGDALIQFNELGVAESLLRNDGAKLAHPAVEAMTAMSKTHRHLVPMLLKRPELKPAQALTMFWWAPSESRTRIFERFAVERLTLFEACADLFGQAAKEGWEDPLVKKSLQFVERRQRNRDAIAKSKFDTLEAAIDSLETAPTRESLTDIASMAGVRPACGAQIMADPGGEPLAVLAKATGLKRRYLRQLWQGLRRPIGDENDESTPWGKTLKVYDTLSTNKAQTVLRYWNWALASAMSVQLSVKADEDAEQNTNVLEYPKNVQG